MGTSYHPHPTETLPPCLWPSLGTAWGSAWRHSQWSGTQFGAVLARLEGLVVVTQLRVTQPQRSARVCSGTATGIVADRWDSGVGSYGVLAPSSSSLVLCHAVPCQPHLAVPAGHGGTVACGTGVTQADTSPAPLWGLPSTPGCRAWLGPCRAVTGAVAARMPLP